MMVVMITVSSPDPLPVLLGDIGIQGTLCLPRDKQSSSAREDVASSDDKRSGSLPIFVVMEPTPAVKTALEDPCNEDTSEIRYGFLRVVSLDITLLPFYQLVGRSSSASSSIEIPAPNSLWKRN